jgi:hypothetical protein
MQEQIIISLSSYPDTGVVHTSFIYEELSRQIKSIEALLVGYHFKSRGRVFDVRVIPESVEIVSASMAKFVVVYGVGQFNACADVDYAERASMELLLDIDSDQRKAIITGEYFPEREPDEF